MTVFRTDLILYKLSAFIFIIFRCVRKIAKNDCQLRLVCPSVRIEQLGSHWTDFHEVFLFEHFSKSCRENLSLINPYPANVENTASP